ncbi:2-hydroxyacid dehydrogenase [Puniceicoccales bacterium CK1056]|uniref:2-hydroxyacid dehydrogenase n=1 Tax=Oceanipulchritudo coccoides TaxID=2706888 RepID=A0A6B2LXF4_9BACT|nr:2-hydroxyacid dehydrogenase [Oceanipulchritudo coccoides]NDV61261.1 2-hydroxyacid dehydrogenase [Oceanipulchritudo coccoides]
MRIAFFNTKAYDRRSFEEVNKAFGATIEFLEPRLDRRTTALAQGFEAVCVFVNDTVDEAVLEELSKIGVRLVALRCAGFNNVDLKAAERLGITIVRVPAYSPHAVAEHTVALILALNRKVHRAYTRVRENNFSIDGLLGFDIHGLTAGIVGTGKIGLNVIRIMRGFGCDVLAHDPYPNPEAEALGARYVDKDELFSSSDIISLHCPLTPESHHLIDEIALNKMKDGVMIINTSRGALVDTRAVINGLKKGKIGYLGLDVYEEEGDLFFEDLSDKVMQDDVFARLTTFPNVMVTGHQAFFTRNALEAIARTTLNSITEFQKSGSCLNAVPCKPAS